MVLGLMHEARGLFNRREVTPPGAEGCDSPPDKGPVEAVVVDDQLPGVGRHKEVVAGRPPQGIKGGLGTRYRVLPRLGALKREGWRSQENQQGREEKETGGAHLCSLHLRLPRARGRSLPGTASARHWP